MAEIKVLGKKLSEIAGKIRVETKAGLAAINGIELALQPNPAIDTAQFQTNISKAQEHLTLISMIVTRGLTLQVKLEVFRKELGWLVEETTNKALLDSDIMTAKPQAVQKAMVAERIAEFDTVVHDAEILGMKVTTYMKVLVETQNYVRRTMTNLSMQVGVLKVERSLEPSVSPPDVQEGEVDI